MLMRERGTGVSSLPLNTECQLLGIKYRPEYPAVNLILQFIGQELMWKIDCIH